MLQPPTDLAMGWKPDPEGEPRECWWTGTQWTITYREVPDEPPC